MTWAEPEAAPMDQKEIERLRQHYDNTDLSKSVERATWETDVDADPMVTTSLRLPKSVLDRVRAQAEGSHVKPTALLRQWIEERVAGDDPTVDDRLRRLEDAVFTQHDSAPR